jgi:hypothetical protein
VKTDCGDLCVGGPNIESSHHIDRKGLHEVKIEGGDRTRSIEQKDEVERVTRTYARKLAAAISGGCGCNRLGKVDRADGEGVAHSVGRVGARPSFVLVGRADGAVATLTVGGSIAL